MPATFAHPAFAWPCLRWLPALPVVLGTMVPDIAHLLPRRPWTDHTALSLLTFSLPVGFALWLFLDGWLLRGLTRWVPLRWQADVRARLSSSPSWRTAALGIVAGAATHIGLDHVTHEYGAIVSAVPVVFRAEIGPLPLFKWLQYGLGVAGTLFLADRALRFDRSQPRAALGPRALIGLGAFAVFVVDGSFRHAEAETWWMTGWMAFQVYAVQFAAGGLVLTAYGLLVLGVLGRIFDAWDGFRARRRESVNTERREREAARRPESHQVSP